MGKLLLLVDKRLKSVNRAGLAVDTTGISCGLKFKNKSFQVPICSDYIRRLTRLVTIP